MNTIKRTGDWQQIKIMRDRYNYLIAEAFELDARIEQRNANHQPAALLLNSLQEIKSELRQLDFTIHKLLFTR